MAGSSIFSVNFTKSKDSSYSKLAYVDLEKSSDPEMLYRSQAREGSHVARLNFKTSGVGVYKYFMSLSEIERKFFVLVWILEKGVEMRCEETITVLQFLS